MGDPVMSIEMRLALTSRREWLQWKRLKSSATAGSSELVSNTSQDWTLIVQRPVKVDLDQLAVPAGLEIPFPAEAAPPVAPLLQTDEPRLTDAPRAQELNPWATAGAQSSTPQERSAVATMPEERAARTAEQPQLQQPSMAWPANPPQQPQRLALESAVTQASDRTQRPALPAVAAPQGQSVVLSVAMLRLDRFRNQSNKVAHTKAHRWSRQCVSELNRVRHNVLDITCDARFDWKCYVAFRRDAVSVIGEGIVKFDFRKFHVQIADEHFSRGDFVAHRLDGSCVRLHPLEKTWLGTDDEAIPIYGHLADWKPLAVVASHGPVWHGENEYVQAVASPMPVRQALGSNDRYRNGRAREFLQRQWDEWATDPRRRPFRREVFRSEWDCASYFLNSCAADVTLHDGGLVMCGIALTLATHAWPDVPCFIAQTANRTRFHLIPALNKPDYFRLDWLNIGDD
jgi:hypothetical protein